MKVIIKSILKHIFMILLITIILLPIIYLISIAFRPNDSILAPLYSPSTWTFSSNADKKTNTISKRKLFKLIDSSIKNITKDSSKTPNLKKWIYSNGEDKGVFLKGYSNFVITFNNSKREELYEVLYDNNGELKYRWDKRFTFDNFIFFFKGSKAEGSQYKYPIKQWFYNSMIISLTVTVIQVLVVLLASFALSRFRFRGRKPIILLIVVLQVFPSSMMMMAFYLMLDYIGNIVPSIGLNTIPGLISIYLGVGIPLNIWLAQGYFSTLPASLEESAMIDGASHFEMFFYIIFPLIIPLATVIALLSFIVCYNEFLLAMFLITKPEYFTLPVGLRFFMDSDVIQYSRFSAISIIGSIPVLILWLMFQKYLIAGLTHSSVKE